MMERICAHVQERGILIVAKCPYRDRLVQKESGIPGYRASTSRRNPAKAL
ncbi:MAG: hypothetical protein MZU97_19040 [Bacillus subtilis]|nr:hypothetical protein [Bacillus subtilis]